MRRSGRFRPTLEDVVETSGIETLHPGGLSMTRRCAEVAGLGPGHEVLDVSSGRGTHAVLYARELGADVTGIDISAEMLRSSRALAEAAGLSDRVRFERGDSQSLPFPDARFDVVINECAVGIPDDPQRVLDEMVRVLRPGGRIVIHESTWRAPLRDAEKRELCERFGTTPFERDEWLAMLARAGADELGSELEPWSSPETYWQMRQDRTVSRPSDVLDPGERLRTALRVAGRFGLRGLLIAFRNERAIVRAVQEGKLGYGLYWGHRPNARSAG